MQFYSHGLNQNLWQEGWWDEMKSFQRTRRHTESITAANGPLDVLGLEEGGSADLPLPADPVLALAAECRAWGRRSRCIIR